MQHDHQRNRPGLGAQDFESAGGAVDIDGLRPCGPRAACSQQENGKSPSEQHGSQLHGSVFVRPLHLLMPQMRASFVSPFGKKRNHLLCMGLFSRFLVWGKWLIVFCSTITGEFGPVWVPGSGNPNVANSLLIWAVTGGITDEISYRIGRGGGHWPGCTGSHRGSANWRWRRPRGRRRDGRRIRMIAIGTARPSSSGNASRASIRRSSRGSTKSPRARSSSRTAIATDPKRR